MNKNRVIYTLIIMFMCSTYQTQTHNHSGGGYFFGGLVTGTLLSTALSRSNYRSDRDYASAVERENDRLRDEIDNLRDENAELRAELKAAQRAMRNTNKTAIPRTR
jgi:hypothetical protein